MSLRCFHRGTMRGQHAEMPVCALLFVFRVGVKPLSVLFFLSFSPDVHAIGLPVMSFVQFYSERGTFSRF